MTEAVRVLVVDDEPYITDVLSSALVFEGFATVEAATGDRRAGQGPDR